MDQAVDKWFREICERHGISGRNRKLRTMLALYLKATTGNRRQITNKEADRIIGHAYIHGLDSLPAYIASTLPLATSKKTAATVDWLDPKLARTQNRYVHNQIIGNFVGKHFYRSPEWRRLRYAALLAAEGKCQACGRVPESHGIVLHVDHVKPKSLFPELALDPQNVQVLCADCNMAKSNSDWTQWKRKTA